jgi:hypothetical protein
MAQNGNDQGGGRGLVPHTSNPVGALQKRFPEERFNTLLPVVHVGQLPRGTQLSVREVRVRGDDFDTFGVEGKRGLTKVTLDKIAAAAGITWLGVERTDDRSHPHVRSYTVHGRVTDFDGTVRDIFESKTIDLRDDDGAGQQGKDRAGIKSDKQLAQYRKFIDEHCVSKARNRAIASILAIKRAYTKDELQKPFIVPKLIPDTDDPLAQKAVLATMVGAEHALFGRPDDQKIIEATFHEPESDAGDPPPLANGEAASEASMGALPSDAANTDEPPPLDEPPHDPDTGEVLGGPADAETVKQRVTVAWNRLRHAMPSLKDEALKLEWRSLLQTSTGKAKWTELETLEDLAMLDAAVEARIQQVLS